MLVSLTKRFFCRLPPQAVNLCAFRKTWCPALWPSSAWVSP